MISTVEKVLFLKGVDLFKNIPGEELSHIAQITDEVEIDAQSLIFKEGDQGDAMYLIADGKVKVHSGERVFAELGQKQCFGEMSILTGQPRMASVVALARCELLELDRPTLDGITKTHPHVWDVLREFAQKRAVAPPPPS